MYTNNVTEVGSATYVTSYEDKIRTCIAAKKNLIFLNNSSGGDITMVIIGTHFGQVILFICRIVRPALARSSDI